MPKKMVKSLQSITEVSACLILKWTQQKKENHFSEKKAYRKGRKAA